MSSSYQMPIGCPGVSDQKKLNNAVVWIAILTALLLLRAWPRLLFPEVWNEDATILSGWIKDGIQSIGQPINGYLVILPRIIAGLALSISFIDYPAISTYLTWIVTILIVTFFALSPSRLKGTKWAAAATLLIPSDSEAFGLPLYLLWWSALILFAVLFWSKDGTYLAVRVILLAIASLSSPVCIATLPAYFARGILLRRHTNEIVLSAFALLFVIVQLYAMWPIAARGILSPDDFLLIAPKFIGSYFVGNLAPSLEGITGVFGAILFFALITHRRDSWTIIGLAYLWGVSILMSITRVDIHIIHQVFAGPRYFFLPYILQSWILVQVIFLYRNDWPSWLAIGMLTTAITNSTPQLWRHHANLDWQKHAVSCMHFKTYDMPVHFNGSIDRLWHLRLNKDDCIYLLKEHVSPKTIPFKQASLNKKYLRHSVKESALLESNWEAQKAISKSAPLLKDFTILTPPNDLDSKVRIRVTRGETILLRPTFSGAHPRIVVEGNEDIFFENIPKRSDWIGLEFSNNRLPMEFIVKITSPANSEDTNIAIALMSEQQN